ncbi:unnamed protein product [Polarella glacialis]|uniref:Carboxyvinyl-carboxyphosphonate phosphorylmutase n=1 Tax=Polarella glacialis TaxID=89957 RepID=A0A813IWH8_POLGL|nr:unnamed protein product [Polarella glacialis]
MLRRCISRVGPCQQRWFSATPARLLRNALEAPEILVAPGCYDSFTATLIEQAQFKACYLSGAGVSYSHTGRPDVGLVTATEMVSRIAAIAEAVKLPIIADGDTGYGNAVNVMRTVRMYEQVGCSAIQLEDQQFPKRCGHLAGKTLVSAVEMAGKVRAACDARRSSDFVVIARTDALVTHGMDEALARAELYLEAGADVIFVESPASREDLEAVAKRLGGRVPLLANMVEGGKTPLFTNKELQEMGYSLVIYPNAILRGVAKVGQDILDDLKQNDTTRESLHRMRDFKELNKLLGIEDFRQAEERYLPKN